jgi:hypothetical protein
MEPHCTTPGNAQTYQISRHLHPSLVQDVCCFAN